MPNRSRFIFEYDTELLLDVFWLSCATYFLASVWFRYRQEPEMLQNFKSSYFFFMFPGNLGYNTLIRSSSVSTVSEATSRVWKNLEDKSYFGFGRSTEQRRRNPTVEILVDQEVNVKLCVESWLGVPLVVIIRMRRLLDSEEDHETHNISNMMLICGGALSSEIAKRAHGMFHCWTSTKHMVSETASFRSDVIFYVKLRQRSLSVRLNGSHIEEIYQTLRLTP